MFSPFEFMRRSYAPTNEFRRQFRTFPIAIANKPELEGGDKIILPQSAFQTLVQLEISYPMMFKISNPITSQSMHCGVIEFSADEGMAYVPYWIMDFLCLEPASMCEIINVTLPKGTYVEFQPHTYRFAELSNPRALLEHSLRNYTTLTKGTTLSIEYLDEVYKIDVVNLKPADAVLIVETDIKVEFLPPKDNDEYEKKLEALKAARAAEASASVAALTSSSSSSTFKTNTNAAAGSTSAQSSGVNIVGGGLASSPTAASSNGTKRNPIFDRPGFKLSGSVTQGREESKSSAATMQAASSAVSPRAGTGSSSPTVSDGASGANDSTVIRQVIGKWVYTKDRSGRLISREPVSSAKFIK